MKTVINIKADKEVKEGAKKLARELGLPLSVVINAQLKQFIRNRSLYLAEIPSMTPKLEKLLERAEKDLKSWKNMSPIFNSADDAINYLGRL
uniref:Uncharacterized protein n=1 Tax=Candidatus Giovannonibacteria bacterium GW2011_GWF2_42_19 TaxID=1618659 RepID=A0A0G0ZIX7_9BACT|nr:MAG: hypothetical protein UV11_C0006G0065 [Candidatus Giovannonibacteria bacterium GW2011_GWF2_42_19]